MSDAKNVVRLGARGSLLSRLQSGMVARLVEALGVKVEMVTVTTSGDRIQDRPLHEMGGKGLFTRELELALIRGEVDFAVHSFKDVPVTMPLVDTAELVIAATPLREDPRDALVSTVGKTIADLPAGARVGTGSLRRQAQLLAVRPDLKVEPIRGNVDTRLKKLQSGEYDAVILAMAGLKRSGLFDASMMTAIEMDVLLPAAGQGALALQCRRDDHELRALLDKLNHAASSLAVRLERAVVLGLNGDCYSPIAALAMVEGERVTLKAAAAARGGRPPIVRAQATASVAEAQRAPQEVVQQLKDQGAMELLGT